MCRIPLKRLITGNLLEADYPKLALGQKAIADSGIFIVDKQVSIADVEQISRDAHAENPVELVVVDYLQLLSYTVSKHMNEEQCVNDAGIRLKALAKELSCVTMGLTQLSKDGWASRCKALKDHSDIFMVIRKNEEGDRFINVDKQRDGATGEVPVGWFPECAAVY